MHIAKNKQTLKVVFLSAEVAPIAKAGGLGDVGGALPKAIGKLGIDIRIMLPFYGMIDKKTLKLKKAASGILVKAGSRREKIDVYETRLPASEIKVYLIKSSCFDGDNIYYGGRVKKGSHYTRRYDDIRRFAFFTKAVLAAMKKLLLRPDIIHINDWHTAILSALLKTDGQNDGFFKDTRTLYTIHNLANQGIARPKIVGYAELEPGLPIIKRDMRDGDINFMVQGILGSDLINTVSPSYAKEILTSVQGAGLDNILIKRKQQLSGILNGIDTDFYDPAKDKFIHQRYSLESLDKKYKNKLFLQKKLGLPADKKIMLAGLVSRLVWQKGIEIAGEAVLNCLRKNKDCQFVFLGSGDGKYEKMLFGLAKKYPANVKAIIGFDIKLAQQIYAGSDIFLMPSRYEPCGLGQMIAMRYGTVPLVRATGGLKDTVDNRVGFSFKRYSAAGLARVLGKALGMYRNKPKEWKLLQINGMKKDFSWDKSAQDYLKLYKKLISK